MPYSSACSSALLWPSGLQGNARLSPPTGDRRAEIRAETPAAGAASALRCLFVPPKTTDGQRCQGLGDKKCFHGGEIVISGMHNSPVGTVTY